MLDGIEMMRISRLCELCAYVVNISELNKLSLRFFESAKSSL